MALRIEKVEPASRRAQSAEPSIEALRAYAFYAVLLGALALLYTYLPYYSGFFDALTHRLIGWGYVAYLALGYPWLVLSVAISNRFGLEPKWRRISRSILDLARYLGRLVARSERPKLDPDSADELRSLAIKAFFSPLMLAFLIGNIGALARVIASFASGSMPLSIQGVYPLVIDAIFLLDVAIFLFGYLVESPYLGNLIRSSNPFLLAWLVALACYPPFNSLVGMLLPTVNGPLLFSNPVVLGVLLVLQALLFAFYVSASVALGFKASNLTNRGIVTYGPYRIIRHPAYAAKNLAWFLQRLPYLTTTLVLTTIAWAVIYALRAVTEEWHLVEEPKYREYMERVRYRFIPGIF